MTQSDKFGMLQQLSPFTDLTDTLTDQRWTVLRYFSLYRIIVTGLFAGLAFVGKLFGNGVRFRVNMRRACDLAIAEQNVDVSRIPTLMVAVD